MKNIREVVYSNVKIRLVNELVQCLFVVFLVSMTTVPPKVRLLRKVMCHFKV